MSRIARKPVMIPAGVKVAVNPAARTVNFEGPKGKLSMTYRPEVGVKLEGAIVEVTMDPAIVELGSNRAFWGTTRALIATAVEGVLKGAEFDTLWLQAMINHHRGAIAMAETEIADGRSADMITMATTMVATQQAEIDQMTTILAGLET